ncbi:MAG: hypothetical protein G8345_08105 [Magnetococcales bacterium]|nr:hypothetical protein [Magnetococcales bacterium]NGZ26837.1 hypothetical protein [Magnetococcales bacterium]
MIDQAVMLKVEAATQAAQLPALSGKTFTVAKTVTAGDGLSKWLVLMPQGGGKAVADGVVVLKVEGGKNVLGSLVGQTFTVGKAPIVGQGVGKWLVLQPQTATGAAGFKGILSGTGVAGKAGATTQFVNGLVAAPPVDPGLAMALKAAEVELPEVAAAAKGAAGKAAAAKGAAVAAKGGGAAIAKGGAVAGGAAVGVAGKSAASGTIWSGTGTSLGLGLGLGAWGPAILVGALAAVGVGVYSYLKNRDADDTVGELHDAVS